MHHRSDLEKSKGGLSPKEELRKNWKKLGNSPRVRFCWREKGGEHVADSTNIRRSKKGGYHKEWSHLGKKFTKRSAFPCTTGEETGGGQQNREKGPEKKATKGVERTLVTHPGNNPLIRTRKESGGLRGKGAFLWKNRGKTEEPEIQRGAV